MSLDKNNEFNNFILYCLLGLGGLFISTIGIIYNLIWKNIKDLWSYKRSMSRKIQKNSIDIAGINSRCEERKNENKK